eukprot:gene29389-5743_t
MIKPGARPLGLAPVLGPSSYPPLSALSQGVSLQPQYHQQYLRPSTMSYDEIEIEDMAWNESLAAYTYSCPCGDLFQIGLDDLRSGEEIARCPSCSLYITVIYDPEDFEGDKPPPAMLHAKVPKEESVTAAARNQTEATAEAHISSLGLSDMASSGLATNSQVAVEAHMSSLAFPRNCERRDFIIRSGLIIFVRGSIARLAEGLGYDNASPVAGWQQRGIVEYDQGYNPEYDSRIGAPLEYPTKFANFASGGRPSARNHATDGRNREGHLVQTRRITKHPSPRQ